MDARLHPRRDEAGRTVTVQQPTSATEPESWADPEAIAIFAPDGLCPAELNGVPLAWAMLPRGVKLDALVGSEAIDPALPALEPRLRQGAGAVVLEPDGRMWVFEPTNHFGGTCATFPKGRIEPGDTPRQTAVREVWEETGLLVQLGECLGDVRHSTTQVRYFLAQRVAGTPVEMGWEAQAMWLVPVGRLPEVMCDAAEQPLVSLIQRRLGGFSMAKAPR